MMDMKANYPEMVVKKSEGLSQSERYLIQKCQSTFLSLWSYPNPYKKDKKGKELCDILAVFENHIFIFSDKYCIFSENTDIQIAWNRWYKHTIENSAQQIISAERWLRQGRSVCIDAKLAHPFPFQIKIDENTRIHRIVVARGAKEACKKYWNGGWGSMAVNTTIEGKQHYCSTDKLGNVTEESANNLFSVGIVLDREKYVHVFDDFTLDCIMDELDTVSDFLEYLDEKERLIADGKQIYAAGEEDILAYYLSTIENEKHCCATSEDYRGNADILYYKEAWYEYINCEGYAIKKECNKVSYIWDNLLERAFSSMMNGTLRNVSHADYGLQSVLFTRFAKPCRVYRRALADGFIDSFYLAISKIGLDNPVMNTFLRSIEMNDNPDTLILVLWVHKPPKIDLDTFLATRKMILEAKALASIPKWPHILHFIGVAKTLNIEVEDSEDFIYIAASDFPNDCEEIRKAKELLSSQSILLGRFATSNSSHEYEKEQEKKTMPYPW